MIPVYGAYYCVLASFAYSLDDVDSAEVGQSDDAVPGRRVSAGSALVRLPLLQSDHVLRRSSVRAHVEDLRLDALPEVAGKRAGQRPAQWSQYPCGGGGAGAREAAGRSDWLSDLCSRLGGWFDLWPDNYWKNLGEYP